MKNRYILLGKIGFTVVFFFIFSCISAQEPQTIDVSDDSWVNQSDSDTNNDGETDLQVVKVKPALEDMVEIIVSDDSWVGEVEPDANHEGETDIQILKDTSTPDTKEGYFRFDILGISGLVDSVLFSVKGALFRDPSYPNYTDDQVFQLEVYGCDDQNWTEGEITWNNKPAATTDLLDTLGILRKTKYYYFNGERLADYINTAKSNGLNSVTFIVRGKDNTPGNRIWLSDKGWEPAKLIYGEIPDHGNREAYMRFDITGVGSSISSAAISVHGALFRDEEWPNYTDDQIFSVDIFGSEDQDWQESTLTWNNRPLPDTELLGTVEIIRKAGRRESIGDGIATFINSAKFKGLPSVTFILRGSISTPLNRVWLSDKGWETPQLNIDMPTSTTMLEENNRLVVYPNPATNELMLKDARQGASLKIVDLQGRNILETVVQSLSIDISFLDRGLYLLRIEEGGHIQTVKFLKK